MAAPRLGWYADDFTGATDALDALTRAGVRAALFIDPPSPGQIQAAGELDAIGIAGNTRGLAEPELRDEVAQALGVLSGSGAPICHYKVCSTFDSAPSAGSIGAAIEVGLELLGGDWAPLLLGVPALGRWCVFGNLFARVGSDGTIERLDRHPVANHPITPMREADVLRHLAAQTDLPSGLVVSHLGGVGDVDVQLRGLAEQGARIRLFDVADHQDLAAAGAAIAAAAARREAPFVAGSSGVEYALIEHWQRQGEVGTAETATPAATDRLVVLSGSCSAVTAGQIEWAAENGFETLALETPRLLADSSRLVEEASERLATALAAGRSVVVHTAVGPEDPRIAAARSVAGGRGLDGLVGDAFARLGEVAVEAGVTRLAVTGGDTSSAAARALGIESVSVRAGVVPGAPLCRVQAPGRPVDGLEILFKGGSLGWQSLFGRLKDGPRAAPA